MLSGTSRFGRAWRAAVRHHTPHLARLGLLAAAAAVLPALAPATALADPPAITSPQVVHTGTGPTGYEVTFRYWDGNPLTTNVKVRGEWFLSDAAHTTRSTSAGRLPTQYLPGDFPIANPNNGAAANWPVMPMTQDPVTLVWSFTTPLPPGTWTYGFLKNCTNATMNSTTGCPTSGELADPSNPPWNVPVVPPASNEPDSEAYVPADTSFGTTDFSWQAPNPVHSALADVTYPSPQSTSPVGVHPLAVCTPPGYDPSRATPYPTLYLSHGAGGNEVDWSTQGVACTIFDNLLAAGQVQPMVVVMTNFNGISGGVGGYSTDVLSNVIPYVEAHYNVLHGAANRAFGGLSAGGQRANDLLFNHTDQFGYYGVWSNAGGTPSSTSPAWANPALLHLLGLDIGAGNFDSIGTQTVSEEAALTTHGIPFVDDSLNAGHEWYTWRIELHHFLGTVAFRHTTASASGPASTVFGQAATFTSTVAGDTTEPAGPTGTVAFYLDGVLDAAHLLGTAPVAGGGTASLTVGYPPGSPSTIPVGTHTVTAVYGGDTLYNPSTSSAFSYTVAPDTAAPVTTATLTPGIHNGWYASPTLTLTADDSPGSGVAHVDYSLDGGPRQTYTGPLSGFSTGNHFVQFQATDFVGNVEALKLIAFKVDAVAPSVNVVHPFDGETIPLGKVEVATYKCVDRESGLDTCTGPVPSGSPIDTSTAGDHTFTVTATDEAGNRTTVTHHYTVQPRG